MNDQILDFIPTFDKIMPVIASKTHWPIQSKWDKSKSLLVCRLMDLQQNSAQVFNETIKASRAVT